jgi:hypothetical protein
MRTRGKERWDAVMEALHSISTSPRFTPPPTEVAILVPYDVLDAAGWKQVMHAFVKLDAARVWSAMLSAREVERSPEALKKYRAVVVPALPFASDKLIAHLQRYTQQGGALIDASAKIARGGLADQSWVLDIGMSSLRNTHVALKRPHKPPRAEPGLQPRHYLYEHSSNWILPYLGER